MPPKKTASQLNEWLIILCMLSVMMTMVIFTVTKLPDKDVEDKERYTKGELLSVSFVFRHGTRTPTKLQDDDPYKNYSWPEGLGGLTRNGKNMMYEYGQLLRKRYRGYLNHVLVRNIVADSSPVQRCLSSSVAVLGGMFPPTKSEIWSFSLDIGHLWQPIAVQTVELKRAYMLGDETDCPVAEALKEKVDQLPALKEFLAANQDFIERFTKYSGYNATAKWSVITKVHDALTCELDYFGDQFKWPTWMAQVGPDCWQQMKVFRDFGFEIEGKLGLQFLKLRAGTFLKTMLSRLKNIIDSGEITAENRQVFLYSTHDTVVSWILQTMSFFKEQPNFGSGLIIELRRNPHTLSPTIHLYYANVTNDFDIYELSLNKSNTFQSRCHKNSCSFNDFAASLQTYLPIDIEKECGAQSNH